MTTADGWAMTLLRTLGRVITNEWQYVAMGPRTAVTVQGRISRRPYWSLTVDSPQKASYYADDLRQRLPKLGPEGLLADLGV